MRSFDTIFQDLWFRDDYINAYLEFISFLKDKDDLNGAECYSEKLANETFFLEHLLEKWPELLHQVNLTLKELSVEADIRITLLYSVQQAITRNPSISYDQFKELYKLIMDNLSTHVGLESLILIILHNLDRFAQEDIKKIITELEKNTQIQPKGSDPIWNIGFNVLKGFHQFLNQEYNTISGVFTKVVEQITPNLWGSDTTNTISYIHIFFFCLANLKRFFSEFQKLDLIFNKLEEKKPISRFWKSEESRFWEQYSDGVNIIIENVFNVIYNPVFLSAESHINNIDTILDGIIDAFKKFIPFYFVDTLWDRRSDYNDFIKSLFKIPKLTADCFIHLTNYAIYIKDLSNLDAEFDESKYSTLEEYRNASRTNLDYIYLMPIRIICKKLFLVLEEKQNLYTSVRQILASILLQRKKLIPILGPFSEKDPSSLVNQYFQQIALILSNPPYNLTPVFIPANFQGIKNSIIFELFIQMSRFIVCLYIPSNRSAGHVDEIARILERRSKPPIILLSHCDFPTTTQMEGIASNKMIKIFCFNEHECSHQAKCIFAK